MNRNRLMALVGIAISVVALWFALRGLHWNELAGAFRQVNYLAVLPASALILADYWFRTIRWRYILSPMKKIPTARLFPVLVIGFAANNIAPARLGELWRVWGLDHKEGVGKSLALATLVVERVFDGFTLLFLLAIFSLWQPLTGDAQYMETLFLLLFGVILSGMIFLLVAESLALRIVERLLVVFPASMRTKLLGMLRRFVQGLHSLRSPRALGAIVLTSLAAWLCEAAAYYVLMQGFGLPMAPGPMAGAAIFTLCMINLGILIPAGPGYVGVFEGFGKMALVTILGQPEALSVALVIFSHGLQYALITGLGLLFAAREGLNLFNGQPAEGSDDRGPLVAAE